MNAGLVSNIIRTNAMHYRTRTQLGTAGISEDAFPNFRAYARVVKRFHLITPHAMQVLDEDPKLLKRLDKCFKRSHELTMDLFDELITKKGLLVTPFGKTTAYFYGVRGAGEQTAYRTLLDDYNKEPAPHDIALILEVDGIELDIPIPALSNFGRSRRYSLHFILDPTKFDLCSYIRKKGIKRVTILPPSHELSREGIVVKIFGKEEINTLFIPIEELNTTQLLDIKIISAVQRGPK